MFHFSLFRRCLTLFICGAALFSTTLFAQGIDTQVTPNAVKALESRYPTGSIQSKEKANAALSAVKAAKQNAKKQFALEEAYCYRHEFFANDCRDEALKRKQAANKHFHAIEIEAKRFKRKLALSEREQIITEYLKEREQITIRKTK